MPRKRASTAGASRYTAADTAPQNEDSNKIRARFMEDFPSMTTYRTFDRPNWFKVKVGDFRTREEAAMVFFDILEQIP